MALSAVILDTEFSPVSADFSILDDDGFSAIEKIAANCAAQCCIRWTRESDGQAGYWSPSGASLSPHWYHGKQHNHE